MIRNIKIYLLGTTHTTAKSKKQVEKALHDLKLDAVLSEGVINRLDDLTSNLLLKEPFLLPIIKFWFWVAKKRGTEFDVAEKISKEKNIYFHNIDLSLAEIINYFHKWYNSLIFIMMLFLAYILAASNPHFPRFFALLLFVFFAPIFYLGYFLLRVKKLRDDNFVRAIKVLSAEKKYENIIFICGKEHCQSIRNQLDVTDLTDT